MEPIIEVIIEFVFEIVVTYLADVWSRGQRSPEPAKISRSRDKPLIVFVGAALGYASTWIFQSRYFNDVWLMMVSILVIPVIVAKIFSLIGTRRLAKDKKTGTLESFWTAWWFSMAYLITRAIALGPIVSSDIF
jgi:hypothetical protein